MSWFFGSKKSKGSSSQPPSLVTDAAALEVKYDDEFVVVSNEGKINHGGVNDPAPLYPLIPGSASSSSPNRTNGTSTKTVMPTSQIQGVPFRLSKDANMLAMTEQSHQFVLQRAWGAINNVDQSAFKYDFSVEKSVLKETNQF